MANKRDEKTSFDIILNLVLGYREHTNKIYEILDRQKNKIKELEEALAGLSMRAKSSENQAIYERYKKTLVDKLENELKDAKSCNVFGMCDMCEKEVEELHRVFVDDLSIERNRNGSHCHGLKLCPKCIKERLKIEVTEDEL